MPRKGIYNNSVKLLLALSIFQSKFIFLLDNYVETNSEGDRKTCTLAQQVNILTKLQKIKRERSGSVVECLTQDRRAAGSSLTSVTALWSLSKTHLS